MEVPLLDPHLQNGLRSYQDALSLLMVSKQGHIMMVVLLVSTLERRRSAQWDIVRSLPEVVFYIRALRPGLFSRTSR